MTAMVMNDSIEYLVNVTNALNRPDPPDAKLPGLGKGVDARDEVGPVEPGGG
jgi:hypothetical protein